MALAGQLCGPGRSVIGFDANGNIVCSAGSSPTHAIVDGGSAVGLFTSIAIGADGLPVVSYFDKSNVNLKVAHCGNAACTFDNTLTTVDDIVGSSVGEHTSIAIGVDGVPVVSYFSVLDGLKVAHCDNVKCTSSTLTIVDGTGAVGEYTSIAIGADGHPVVSYYDSTNADLKVAHCGDATCTAGNTLTTVDSTGLVGFFTSIAIGADGLPVVSYLSITTLKVAHCDNVECTTSTLTTVDGTGDLGFEQISIAIGADGLPVVSYLGDTNRDLKVAHCGNAACTAGNTLTTVDSSPNVGSFSSIAIGADGLPVVSYRDEGNRHLKVAHCGNAACTAGNTLSAVDSTGNDVGQHTSIAIGADGLPVVSYRDVSKGLKVAHCGKADCSP